MVPNKLRLLSYNIQAGLTQERTHQYFTKSWRHLLPHKERQQNLEEIGKILGDFDIVALQEIDPGSLRSGYVNQIEFLAKTSGFAYWYYQINRNLGRLAKYGNAVLSRFKPYHVDHHRLPGILPGRGAIRLFYGEPHNPLVIVIMHLSLGTFSQRLQLDYVRHLVSQYQNIIIMGDLNCQLNQLFKTPLLVQHQIRPVNYFYNTYPSWKPKQIIDHILVSPTVKVEHVSVLELPYSDHLPVAITVEWPNG